MLKLCGTYPIGFGLPDWWEELIEELERKNWRWSSIVDLFKSASAEEFRQGKFQIKRHKEYRQRFGEDERKIMSSPKIGKFLKEQFGVKHRFTVAFHDRGAKLLKKEAVVTADPWDIVNMATRGKSWASCQDFTDSCYNNCEVWANLCDPGMIIVFARTRKDKSEKNMDTRVIIRYARNYRSKPRENPLQGIIIDKFYGDAAYIQGIQKLILKLCKKHGLCLFEYEHYSSHENSEINYQIKQKIKSRPFTVYGPSAEFPYLPYTDNSQWIREKRHKNFYHLKAKVRLIFSPST